MNAIKTLVDEHDNILRLLDVVHIASMEALCGAPVVTDDFREIIDFIRKYADRTHHGKEEDYLFKAMVDELGTVAENLIRYGMLVEHDIGRLYVSDLDEALTRYDGNPDGEAKLAIIVAAGSYEQLLRRHIQKENDVVFSFGEKNLAKNPLTWVTEQIRAFEEDPQNIAERERQLSVLDKLEKKYIK